MFLCSAPPGPRTVASLGAFSAGLSLSSGTGGHSGHSEEGLQDRLESRALSAGFLHLLIFRGTFNELAPYLLSL